MIGLSRVGPGAIANMRTITMQTQALHATPTKKLHKHDQLELENRATQSQNVNNERQKNNNKTEKGRAEDTYKQARKRLRMMKPSTITVSNRTCRRKLSDEHTTHIHRVTDMNTTNDDDTNTHDSHQE